MKHTAFMMALTVITNIDEKGRNRGCSCSMKPKLKAEKESTQNLWLAHIMCQKIIYFTNLYLYNYIYPCIIDYIFYQRGHSTFIQVVSKMSLYEALHLFPQKRKIQKRVF